MSLCLCEWDKLYRERGREREREGEEGREGGGQAQHREYFYKYFFRGETQAINMSSKRHVQKKDILFIFLYNFLN